MASPEALDIIQQFPRQGCSALNALQKKCAVVTVEAQQRATAEFTVLERREDETATAFIKRVGNKITELKRLRVETSEEARLSRYLYGMGEHKRYDNIIATFKTQQRNFERGQISSPPTITDLEIDLQTADEDAGMGIRLGK